MRSGEGLAGERREPFGVGMKEEIDFQTKEGLQVFQGMNKKEERPEDNALIHTAATEGVV